MTLDELTQRGIEQGLPPYEARCRAWHFVAGRGMLRRIETPQVERDENGMPVAFYPVPVESTKGETNVEN